MNKMKKYTWIHWECIHEYNGDVYMNTMKMDEWIRVKGWMDERMEGWKYGRVKVYMDKNMEGWKDGWMWGWKCESIYG